MDSVKNNPNITCVEIADCTIQPEKSDLMKDLFDSLPNLTSIRYGMYWDDEFDIPQTLNESKHLLDNSGTLTLSSSVSSDMIIFIRQDAPIMINYDKNWRATNPDGIMIRTHTAMIDSDANGVITIRLVSDIVTSLNMNLAENTSPGEHDTINIPHTSIQRIQFLEIHQWNYKVLDEKGFTHLLHPQPLWTTYIETIELPAD